MVKSHRSSSTLFNTWANYEPPPPLKLTREPVVPASPSRIDPFSSISRTASIVTPTTPTIILASPSTSTIHYLFPTSDTRTHLSVSDRPLTRSQSTVSRQRPALPPSRSSFDQSEKTRSEERKTLENAFGIPPSRHDDRASQKSQNILGPAKRISSVSISGSIRRSENSQPLLNSPPKHRNTRTIGHTSKQRMIHGQPDVAVVEMLRAESFGKENRDGSKQKESTIVGKKDSWRESDMTTEVSDSAMPLLMIAHYRSRCSSPDKVNHPCETTGAPTKHMRSYDDKCSSPTTQSISFVHESRSLDPQLTRPSSARLR